MIKRPKSLAELELLSRASAHHARIMVDPSDFQKIAIEAGPAARIRREPGTCEIDLPGTEVVIVREPQVGEEVSFKKEVNGVLTEGRGAITAKSGDIVEVRDGTGIWNGSIQTIRKLVD